MSHNFINIECPQCATTFVHRFHERYEAWPTKDYMKGEEKGRIEGLKEAYRIIDMHAEKAMFSIHYFGNSMMKILEELINKQEST